MPYIEVTEAQLAFLQVAKKVLNTQDNRCTANVIFVGQHEVERVTHPDYSNDATMVANSDADFHGTPEQFAEHWYEYRADNDTEESEFFYAFWASIKGSTPGKVRRLKKKTFVSDFMKAWQYHMWSCCDDIHSIFFGLDLDLDIPKGFREYRILAISKEWQVKESGLFSFFEPDIKAHQRMDGHNHRGNFRSWGASIQRTPMMLELMTFLSTGDFSRKVIK